MFNVISLRLIHIKMKCYDIMITKRHVIRMQEEMKLLKKDEVKSMFKKCKDYFIFIHLFLYLY